MKSAVFLGFSLLVVCAIAQERPIAFTGARVIPIAGPEIPSGVVVIQNGRIVTVGSASSTAVPADAERRDCTGKVIMPGLVDSHSHIGRIEGGDASAPIQPDVRVLDTFEARDARIQKAQAGGITTVNVMPGSGHLLSGQTLYLKLRDGRKVDDFLIRLPDGRIAGGIKMANGTNSRRSSPFPGTRGKSAAMVREQFVKAQEYRDKIATANGDASKLPARDLRLEMLVEALEGKRLIQHHTHAHDDIATVLRLAKEFGLKVVLQHGTEGYKVAQEIAAAGVPLTTTMLDSPGGKIETRDASFANPAILDRAGVLVGFNTDDSVTDSRWFLRAAALAVRAGMPREKALYGLTMANARMLDLQDRVGSIEPGKDADLVILSGEPLSVYTKVLETWVDGKRVFDRSNPKDLLYATGGYGASHDSSYGFEVEEY
jgi:imidazolonepropionase-like amidohydrolase